MKKRNIKRAAIIFIVALVVAVGCIIGGIIKTDIYNRTKHVDTFAGEIDARESVDAGRRTVCAQNRQRHP